MDEIFPEADPILPTFCGKKTILGEFLTAVKESLRE